MQRYGDDTIGALRLALERLARPTAAGALPSPARPAGAAAPGSLLFTGIAPQPGNWRASVRRPVTLPQYPIVLHRGGYPDGS